MTCRQRPRAGAGLDPRRLEAIERQAENVSDCVLLGVEAVGHLSANAASTGEVGNGTWTDIGWLTAFLFELARTCNLYADNAHFELEGGFAAVEVREQREHIVSATDTSKSGSKNH